MAILSLLLSYISRQLGTIVQAIFGWSVTALFGRLPGKKQIAVTVALVISIAWPVFMVGLGFPVVAGWALAFLPIGKWLGPVAMRVVWGALAVLSPLLVGGLVHWAAPAKKGGLGRSLLNGYPLALGLFSAFVLTAVTVPLVKIASILRGWSDEHVYVQPRMGRYEAALRDVAEACARAGAIPTIGAPPRYMTLPTVVLRWLARGAVQPIVAEEVRCVRAAGLEIYLYPSDLLVRGKEAPASRFRAMLTRTNIDADAYLVASDAAQGIQDELGRLIEDLVAHRAAKHAVGGALASRLREIWHEMNDAALGFDEWVKLESIARRFERRLGSGSEGPGILDSEEDSLAQVAEAANDTGKETTMTQRPRIDDSTAETSTVELVREAFDEARELVKLEVEIAKEEAVAEIQRAKTVAIGFGVAAAGSVLVLSVLAMALVLALGGTPVVALLVASGLFLVAGASGAAAYALLPKDPLGRARGRLKADMNQLKEHIA